MDVLTPIALAVVGLFLLWYVIYSAVRSANRDLVRELLEVRAGRHARLQDRGAEDPDGAEAGTEAPERPRP